jgi:mycothiol synthase
MVRVEPLDDPDRFGPADRRRVDRLLARASAVTGHQPLSEQAERVLDHPTPGRSWALLTGPAPDAVVGFGVLARSRDGWEVEVVVDPDGGPVTSAEDELLRAALACAGESGGGTVRYWAFDVPASHDAAVATLGFVPERTLLQMRVPLPLDAAVRPAGPPLEVRPFRPGDDDAAWLQANNRAFAGHPEQGGWDAATLHEREREPWFDAAGFLLYEEHGRLAGSCWTKVHPSPPMGEIYVISVDPDFAGRGLGRALTVAGLDHLAAAGLAIGMLYVDDANAAAVGLYRSLGFAVDHVDRAYVVDAPTARPMP